MTSWQDIRAVRAHPPGLAASPERRRRTFAAALEQAEQLSRAAEAASYATKPILLFYALAQGLRAVCAARLTERWERAGHGLSVPHRSSSVLDTVVRASPSAADLYHGAMEAVREDPLQGEVSIREIWSSMPELAEVALPGALPPRPLTLRVPYFDDDLSDAEAPVKEPCLFVLIDGDVGAGSAEELEQSLRAYPTLSEARVARYPTGLPTGPLTGEREIDGVVWRRHTQTASEHPLIEFDFEGGTVGELLARFKNVAPHGYNATIRVALAGVGTPTQTLGPLSGWWTLLLALSHLARYRPADWGTSIDVDRAPEAVALERALDRAHRTLPHYIVGPLTE